MASKRGWTAYYNCNKNNCTAAATLKLDELGLEEAILELKNPHTCIDPASTILLFDERGEMASMVKDIAIDHPSRKAPHIASDVWKVFQDKNIGTQLIKLDLVQFIKYDYFRQSIFLVGC